RAMTDEVWTRPDASCLGGPIRLRFEGRPPRMCGAESIGEGKLDLGPDKHDVTEVWSGNMALRRAALDRLGVFRVDLRLMGHTEIEWQRRLRDAGGRVVYLPAAWLWH